MVNVAELLELRYGNPMKPPSSENQGVAGVDLIDEVRVPAEKVMNEVRVQEVSNPNVVEGGVVTVEGDEGVSEEVGGSERTENELNEINLFVDLSGVPEEARGFEQSGINLVVDLHGVSEEVRVFEQSGNELNEVNRAVDLSGVSEEGGDFAQIGDESNGINLVVDLSPQEDLDGKLSYGNGGSDVCLGGLDVPVSDGLGNTFGENVLITEGGKFLEEHMGKECGTEIEGNYEVTDLVWGKVRGHPWWPGQIFDPYSASEKARKLSKDGFLIAYFGDKTYAWNDASQIKPFRKHFSQMVKQSTTEAFCHAVDCTLLEISRRVEFGLACSCLPEDMFMKINSQVVVNAGISEESSRRDGGDRFSSVASFEPAKLVENVKTLAKDPFGVTDRLELVKARAQLSAYHRWKGYYQIPTQTLLNGLVENADNEPEELVAAYESDEGAKYEKSKSTTRDSNSRKRKHISTDRVSSSKKTKLLSEMTSDGCLNMQNNKPVKAGRKKKEVYSLSDDLNGTGDKKSFTSPCKKDYRVGENISKIAGKLSGSALSLKKVDGSSQNSVGRGSGKSTRVRQAKDSRGVEVPAAYPPSDEILSQLYLAAIDPIKKNSTLTSLVRFINDFRSYSIDISNNHSTGEIVSGETARCSPKSGTKELSDLDGIEDTYWTDRIIQNNPEEQQVIFEPEVANLDLMLED